MHYENRINYEGYNCLETHYMQEIPYHVDDIYYTVPKKLENRLDTISYNFYGNVDLWWVIALASNIKMAIIVVGTLPIILIYPFVQKYFTKGVMVGAVKG